MLHLKSSMRSSSILVGLSCSFLAATLALPTDHILAEPRSNIADVHGHSQDDAEFTLSHLISSDLDNSEPISDEQLELSERALPVDTSSKPSMVSDSLLNANASMPILTANNPPQCWPGRPAPRARGPVSDPKDCRAAALEVIQSPERAMEPVRWTSWKTWTVGSCQIRLLPAVVVSQDTFSHFDIFQTAQRIQRSCVDEAHGFRGGIVGIGRARMYDVSVEASRNTPFQPNQVSGVNVA